MNELKRRIWAKYEVKDEDDEDVVRVFRGHPAHMSMIEIPVPRESMRVDEGFLIRDPWDGMVNGRGESRGMMEATTIPNITGPDMFSFSG